MSETMREIVARAAHEGIENYLVGRIENHRRVPWEAAFSADRDVRYAQADAVLAAVADMWCVPVLDLAGGEGVE